MKIIDTNMANRKCKRKGHKWGPGQLEQNCIREGCLAWRVVMQNRYPKIGEPLYEWKIFETPSINIP